MNWSIPLTIALLISAALALVLALLAAKRSSTPGAIPFAFLMAAVAVWDLFRVLEGVAVDIPARVGWAKLEYLGIASVPPLWFLFAQAYSGLGWFPTWRRATALWIIPIVTIALVFTNEHHGLIWRQISVSSADPGAPLVYTHGIGFWIAVVNNYVMLLIGGVIIVGRVIRSPSYFRGQSVALIAGVIVPWFGNIIYLTGLSPVHGLDPTPLAPTLSGLVLFWGMFRHRLFDLTPIAREIVIEQMEDGILVLDAQGRIVDCNPAAARLIAGGDVSCVGKSLEVFSGIFPQLRDLSLRGEGSHAEICSRCLPERYLDVRVTPLHRGRHGQAGQVIQLRDVTARQRAEAQLQAANARLSAQLTENERLQARLREEALHDPLTDLFNRRYLDAILDEELQRATADAVPVSVVMLDIDHFKEINDRFGHDAGDHVLRVLGGLLRRRIRGLDTICRYGGEEFVVVLPATHRSVARDRAEQWRQALQSLTIRFGECDIAVTLSAGVGSFPVDGTEGETILAAADKALYEAKRTGRNRVVTGGDRELAASMSSSAR